MRRKQPARSKRTPKKRGEGDSVRREKSEVRAPDPVVAESPSEPELVRSARLTDRRAPVGLALGTLLVAAVFVFCGLVVFCVSLRLRADVWPSVEDVRLMPLIGAMEAIAFLAASVAAWLAHRFARASKAMPARTLLLVAMGLGGLSVGLRAHEFRELYADGLWQRSIAGPVHERADIYYLQSVRFRLDELFLELDDRRANEPGKFTDEDERHLALVTDLQKNMTSWTEHEVGHWSEDLQHRRDVMKLVAHQVWPLRADQDRMVVSVREQRRELERQREWFEIVRGYCERKMELLSSERKEAGTSGDSSSSPGSDAAETSGAMAAGQASLIALDRELSDKLDALGLSGWSYARSVVLDASNQAMAGERVNQVTARLDAIDSRALFLADAEESVNANPAEEGLNRKNRWLRLPVCLPGGNAWAGGYFALTGLHMSLIVVVSLLSLLALLVGVKANRAAIWRQVQWWWCATSLIGITLFLLFYIV